jgi:heme oxygenase (mycobilin-producing)
MPVAVLFDMLFKPESAEAGLKATSAAVKDTRAFEGNTGVSVLVDEADPAHVVIVEYWKSASHDEAYQAWRAGSGAPTEIIALLARPPRTLHFTVALNL